MRVGDAMTLAELRAQLYALHRADTTLKMVRQQDPDGWNTAAQNQFNRALRAMDWQEAVACLDLQLKT